MAFDRKHYKEIKKFMLWRLNHVSCFSNVTCPIEWVKTFLPLLADCVHREDYEAAKATKDTIREFLNQFMEEKIAEDAMLKLPEIKSYFEFEKRF
jgi:hypothetical protein